MSKYIILLAAFAAALLAQVSTGTLVGDVRDPAAAPVKGAKVTVTNDATGYTRSSLTDAAGTYQFAALPPGKYTVSAEMAGFRTATLPAVSIEVDYKIRQDLTLGVGGDTIDVSARLSPVQTEEASEGYTLDSSTIVSLPLDGRNITSLVTLGPGAIPRQLSGFTHDLINDAQEARGAVSMNPPVNGARSTMNSFILDGSYNTDRNTFAIAVIPPFESVQEFRIQTSLGSAEFAQSGGGVVDVVTKSGSRTFHGSAFEFLRNEATDESTYFSNPDLPPSIFRQNHYGATLGGPLARKSTFFFLSYGRLRNKSAMETLHIVPDATNRTGNFTGREIIYDPLKIDAAGNRQPFAGNLIPASRIDPIAKNFLANFQPLPNNPTNTASNYLDDTPNTTAQDAGLARIDRQFGTRNQLFGRYNINEDSPALAGAFPQRPTEESLRAQQAAIGETYTGSRWI